MRKIPCTYIRGGTSRALFFKEEDLPEDKSLWPELFIKALGVRRTAAGLSAMGVDFPTHKVAVISPHQGPEADVDYNFFQVDSENYYVDNRGNCGNMSSAVGPFAIDEGMVEAREPETVVRIYNTNTRRIITSRVQVKDGKSCTNGDAVICGAPGSGSPVWLSFERPGGGLTGKLFPTGNKIDLFHIPGHGDLPVTLIDCANPVVLFKAADVGLTGTELTSLNTRKDFIELVGRVRGMAAQVFGLVDRWEDAATKSTYMPFVGIVSPPQSYEDMDGNQIEAEEMDICCRSFITRLHRAYPIAASMATAAAARIPGTVAYEVVRKGNAFRADSGEACGKAQGAAADDRNVSRPIGAGNGVVLGHAGGCTEVQMEVDGDEVIRGTVLRTANTIMRGTLWVDEV
ncbi:MULTISPECIES: PrpF domain-containing protein [Enterocloster]|uniref:3-methylitaconate isomerase n=1 Tax=Enterocloster lavalensis TaxID=460384 RepID=A0A1I0EWB0_9FIRM|nr:MULTISPECIES: PrpF domain-containing protein [Enterocloster]MDR3755385.1 PrpF domain-containing protein [Enterocloster sp.]SET49748.1 hypothetical protein SAMN05216313_10778 [Enterocloster lavalensis]